MCGNAQDEDCDGVTDGADVCMEPGAPAISSTSASLGGGLTGYTVGIEFFDGIESSAAADLSFTGMIEQQVYFDAQQQVEFDVDFDSDLISAVLDLDYDELRDSYFLVENTRWQVSGFTEISGGMPGETTFGVTFIATVPPNGILDYQDVAYIVAPDSATIDVTGLISRGGQDFGVTTTIPEPTGFALQVSALLVLAGIARRARIRIFS